MVLFLLKSIDVIDQVSIFQMYWFICFLSIHSFSFLSFVVVVVLNWKLVSNWNTTKNNWKSNFWPPKLMVCILFIWEGVFVCLFVYVYGCIWRWKHTLTNELIETNEINFKKILFNYQFNWSMHWINFDGYWRCIHLNI